MPGAGLISEQEKEGFNISPAYTITYKQVKIQFGNEYCPPVYQTDALQLHEVEICVFNKALFLKKIL